MGSSDSLLHTKFRLPSMRPSLVPRPRLQEQLALGLRGPLTLVTAPAGFGKTTLVAACISGFGMPVAWLSLDKDENQGDRFLNYVVAALHEADNTIGGEAARLLASSQQAPPEAILTALINELDGTGREIALVLDDYQFISSRAVHEQVAFLLQHCPGTFHLVISSRSDPPLPLARLRARGQTVELRGADLCFSPSEAAQFLNEVMGLHLDARSVAVLQERTEGWIAGLQMAALSMRNRQDVPGFIEAFSGTNRYILDYLLEEVLAGQSPDIQRFLLHTAILERLTPPLCDSLLEEGGPAAAARPAGTSASILGYLERANLFLVPLDAECTWYRYHHLFADLLRTQLQRSLGSEGVANLHIRAAAWHEQNGSVLEAIHHASLASDDERLERLVEQNYVELVNRGEMSALRFWTGRLNRELVHRRPRLCLYEAHSHSWFGELDEAEELLEAAEKRLRSSGAPPDAALLLAQLSYVRSRVTAMRGDLPGAIELVLAAREHLPFGNLALMMDTKITLGFLYFLHGDYAQAGQFLNLTVESGKAVGAILNPVAAYCVLARMYAYQGLLHQSHELYLQAGHWIQQIGGQHLGASSLVEVGLADVLCEWNELDRALDHIHRGLLSIHLWGKNDDLVLANLTLARLQLARGEETAAAQAVLEAKQVIAASGIFPEAAGAAELAQVKLWLAREEVQAAGRWAASLEPRLRSGDPFRFENEVIHLARARVWIAMHNAEAALDLLLTLEKAAFSTGRNGRLIEIRLLQALALRLRGESSAALAALEKCLELAAPEGYMRLFLDEGPPMRMLLTQWLAHSAAGPLRDYVAGVLSAFGGQAHPAENGPGPAPAGQPFEVLTQRELEVLQLMALGCTNQEIARQLVVAPGTVKAHTASIYRKLDAANRTGAVARARELSLLP